MKTQNSKSKNQNYSPKVKNSKSFLLFASNFWLWLFLFWFGIISIGVRLMPHFPNFTPMGALALFVGAYLAPRYRWSLLLPLFAMFLSDLFIGFYDLRLMAVVYGSFLVYGIIGMVSLREMSRRDIKQKSAQTVLFGSIGGAVFFYLATNFAVWAFSPWYSHNLQGLVLSYEMALPFFRFTLLGDVFFSALFFGAYEFALRFVSLLQVESKSATRNLAKL